MDPLLLLASTEGAESSQTAFYVAGGVLVLWAVLVSLLGVARDFPNSKATRSVVVAVSVLLVAGAIGSAAVTG